MADHAATRQRAQIGHQGWKSAYADVLHVVPRAGDRTKGWLLARAMRIPCALGRSGISRFKKEGDGATPAGRFGLGRAYVRSDRLPYLQTGLRMQRTNRTDGWCDDPGARDYNRPITLPSPSRHECLWREDQLYDVVVEIAYNVRPRKRGRGSAIFLHVAGNGFSPTEGCVAISRSAIRRLMRMIGPETIVAIH